MQSTNLFTGVRAYSHTHIHTHTHTHTHTLTNTHAHRIKLAYLNHDLVSIVSQYQML